MFVSLCYYSRFEKKAKNKEILSVKEKQKKINEHLSTKKKDLFECHNCFLQKTEKIVKNRSHLIAFCGDECYNKWLVSL